MITLDSEIIEGVYNIECLLNVTFSFIIMIGGFIIWEASRRWSAAAITVLGVQMFVTSVRITLTNVLGVEGIGPGTIVGSIQLGMVTLFLGYVAYLLLWNRFLKSGRFIKKGE